MTELIILLWVLFCATLPPYLNVMHKTVNQNQEPAYKLSGNNSQLILPDGRIYQLNIERALSEFMDQIPKNLDLNRMYINVMSIKDHITDTLPDDASIPLYKSMNAQLNAYAGFFAELFCKVEGGSND